MPEICSFMLLLAAAVYEKEMLDESGPALNRCPLLPFKLHTTHAPINAFASNRWLPIDTVSS
ncbi:hypothetical protein AS026_13835 [Rhizobium altiplani]|uniref:Uncharacterized protein n=1 Tax=Rhizobium altiplani TaxID=1864509 RepID=A0A109JDS5_9HYPH|nr:hypothetical protein AS026_13835 [Rhizobium altiplani]